MDNPTEPSEPDEPNIDPIDPPPLEPTDPEIVEEVDEEEEIPSALLPELDTDALSALAVKRFDRMVKRGRKDVGNTFAVQVLTLMETEDEKLATAISDMEAQSKATIDAAIRALANDRVAFADEHGIGEIARRYMLATQVQNGRFDSV